MKFLVKSTILALTACSLFTSAAFAADDKDDANAKVKTVWVDGKGQTGFADKVNKTHAEMVANGWKFANLEIYTEDGDMKGAFITYERD
jgi:hypothetical protein